MSETTSRFDGAEQRAAQASFNERLRKVQGLIATSPRSEEAKKLDGLINLTTGVGGPSDKSIDTTWTYSIANPYVIDVMHEEDTVVARIAETPPRDALAQGFEIKSDGTPIPWRSDVGPKAFERWIRKKRVLSYFRYAMTVARLYGGSGIVMHIEDGRAPDQPVDLDNIKSITLTRARDRWELIPTEWFTDFGDPRYEMPKIYNVVPRSYGGPTEGAPPRVHADRVLRFDGYELTSEAYARNLWWGGSVVWRAKARIEKFVGTEQAIHILLTEAKEDIVYLKGLAQRLATTKGKAEVDGVLSEISTQRGMLGTTYLDADDRYETRQRSMQGLGDIYDRAVISVAQAAEMPVTLLFGDAARGLSSDDKAGREYYASVIRAMQTDRVLPALEQLLILSFVSDDGPTAGVNVEGWNIEFPPFEAESDAERADREKKQAEADAINIANGVYTAEEVRASRYVNGAPGVIVVEATDPKKKEGVVVRDPDLSDPSATPAETTNQPPGDDVAKTALNGAQVTSMVTVATAVAEGKLEPGQAASILTTAFPITAEEARRIAGAGRTAPSAPVQPDAPAADLLVPIPPRPEDFDDNPASNLPSDEKTDEEKVTNFPKKGGTKKVSMRNSQWPVFDPEFAADLKENWPEIWRKGGNVEGNEQYRKLTPILERGGNVTSKTEDDAVRLREGWVARHRGNHRIAGVIAQVKWYAIGTRGEAYMKRLINEEKKKIRERRAKKNDYAPDSAMVAFYPPPEWAEHLADAPFVDEDAEKLHATLLYLPHVELGRMDELVASMRAVTRDADPFSVRVNGPGVFDNPNANALVYLLGSVGLAELRTRLMSAARSLDMLGEQRHDFIPHMTLGYHDETVPAEAFGGAYASDMPSFDVGELRVVQGDEVIARLPLGRNEDGDEDPTLFDVLSLAFDEDDEKEDAPKKKAQTPAAPSERVRGSKKNPAGSAAGQRGGIEITEDVLEGLRGKVAEHNKRNKTKAKRVNLGMLKAVWRRGAGAFSGTHRPRDRKRRPMKRQQWAMARVNAFLQIVRTGRPKNPKYTGDNDLLPTTHPRHSSERKRDGLMGADALFEYGTHANVEKMDPYSGPTDADLPERVREMSEGARARFVAAFNQTLQDHPDDEARAFAAAYTASRS